MVPPGSRGDTRAQSLVANSLHISRSIGVVAMWTQCNNDWPHHQVISRVAWPLVLWDKSKGCELFYVV